MPASTLKAPDMRTMGAQRVSVVIPCYYSEQTIQKVVIMTREVLVSHGYDYEFVLVNDGSTDATFTRIEELCKQDPKVCGINFAKNFGQHSAIMAGLKHVSGDYIMLMDDDMQTHPSQCMTLLDAMVEGTADVVSAKYPAQQQVFWRRWGSDFTVWTMRALTGRPKGLEASNFLLMRRFVVDEMVKYDGPYVYIQGLLFRTTHNIKNVPVQHFEREVGQSGYTFKSLVRLWSTVLNFSMVPLRFASVSGAILGLVGLIGALVLIIQKLINPSIQTGWSSLMVAIVLCSGIIVMFLGLIGEYLGRLTMTVSRTPQFVVKTLINYKEAPRE